MPCKNGIRKNLERSKEYYKKEKEYDPAKARWSSLADRIYKTHSGFEGLSANERLYFAVGILDGEVYNGGIDQFFSNSSGGYYKVVVDGLLELKAFESLKLLQEAKTIFFGDGDVPCDRQARFKEMRQLTEAEEHGAERPSWYLRIKKINDEYYADPDGLGNKLEWFSEEKDFLEPFKKGAEKISSHNSGGCASSA